MWSKLLQCPKSSQPDIHREVLPSDSAASRTIGTCLHYELCRHARDDCTSKLICHDRLHVAVGKSSSPECQRLLQRIYQNARYTRKRILFPQKIPLEGVSVTRLVFEMGLCILTAHITFVHRDGKIVNRDVITVLLAHGEVASIRSKVAARFCPS